MAAGHLSTLVLGGPGTAEQDSSSTLAVGVAAAVGLIALGRHYISSSSRAVQALAADDVRLCVVTGAASGIGRATVLRLEKLGWHVLALDFAEDSLCELDKSTSQRVRTLVCDVAKPASCEGAFRRAEELISELAVDGLAGLANVAGMIQKSPAACVGDDELRQILAVNCEGPIRLIRLMMPLLLRTKAPTICNVASVTSDIPFPWGGAYSATKGFIGNFSDSLRREAMASNLPLRVSLVKPGFIDTPMTALLPGQQVNWCDEHPKDPFTCGFRISAVRNDFIMRTSRYPGAIGEWLWFLGDPQKPLRNSAEDCADDIVHSLCSKYPHAEYFTTTLMFTLLFNVAARILPKRLLDMWLMNVLL